MKEWVSVDMKGLSKLLEDKGKAFAIFELIQNAWDTEAKHVEVRLESIPGRSLAKLAVADDNPSGFTDLSHGYTMFAESEKKGDPTKRGRFNLGEKLVLALCKEAKIMSTTGTVVFSSDGTRSRSRKKTERGSLFSAEIRMTRSELYEVEAKIDTLIPPPNVSTSFNGSPLTERTPVAEFEAKLPTVISDGEGNLKRSTRKTLVRVYNPRECETPTIYEMGIPVVELVSDKYHVDVQQKVPVNMDRDNVTPGYLRKLRVEVLNAVHDHLSSGDAKETWVTDAMTHDDVNDEAVNAALTKRYGEKRAIYDPSDVEANQRLVSEGYAVIHGSSLPKGAWGNVRRSGAALPSGRLRPTPKPYSSDPNADRAEFVDEADMTEDMKWVIGLTKTLAEQTIGRKIHVVIVKNAHNFSACYGGSRLDYSLSALGKWWFRKTNLKDILRLMIHEFAHEFESSHLSDGFHEACCRIGSKIAILALDEPKLFE